MKRTLRTGAFLRTLAALVTLVLMVLPGGAQVKNKFIKPKDAARYGISQVLPASMPTFVLPAIDKKALLREDSVEASQGVPFRFGKDVATDIDLILKSVKLKTDNASQLPDTTRYFYQIHSPEAYSINLIFDQFELADNATLQIYNADLTMLYGPVTAKENPVDGVFWTDLIQGDRIILELIIVGNSNKKSRLHIARAIHGYKDTFGKAGYGQSGSCNRDIGCEGGWGMYGQGVAMLLLSNGSRFCSGSLVNSTNRNFRPYFLTAFHCLDNNRDRVLAAGEQSQVSSWLFRFKYESGCGPGQDDRNFITMNGSSFRSAFQPSDFALLELYNRPTNGYADVTYAGWTRSTTPATSATGIHHPNGDVQKISFDYNPIISADNNPANAPGTRHWIVNWNLGVTEPGSSGSPLFDQNRRVVGQLAGGPSFCGNSDLRDAYGRFDVSWTGGGTNETRLSNWLDPCGSGVVAMDTEFPANLVGPDNVCTTSTSTYAIPMSYGAAATWTAASGLTPSSGTGHLATVQGVSGFTGYSSLTYTIPTPCGNTQVSKSVFVGTQISGTYYSNYTSYPLNSTNPIAGTATVTISAPGASTFTWTNISGTTASWYTYNSGQQLEITLASGQGASFQVTTNGSCGPGSRMFTFYSTGTSSFAVYPNPSREQLFISAQPAGADQPEDEPESAFLSKQLLTPATAHPFDALLYDRFGKLVKTVQNQAGAATVQLDVSGLQPGHYVLRIMSRGKSYNHHILVKR